MKNESKVVEEPGVWVKEGLRQDLKEMSTQYRAELKKEIKQKEEREIKERRDLLEKEEADIASVGMTRLDLSVEAKGLKQKQKTHDFGIMLQAGLLSVDVANKAGGYMRLEQTKTLIDNSPPHQSLRVSNQRLSRRYRE